MKKILKIYFKGLILLAGAIVVNSIAKLFSLTSWYDFLSDFKAPNVISLVWLFILYPLFLGLLVILVDRLFKK